MCQGHTARKRQKQDLIQGSFSPKIQVLSHLVKETSNKDGANTVAGIVFLPTVIPIITHIESKLDMTQSPPPLPSNRRHVFK